MFSSYDSALLPLPPCWRHVEGKDFGQAVSSAFYFCPYIQMNQTKAITIVIMGHGGAEAEQANNHKQVDECLSLQA